MKAPLTETRRREILALSYWRDDEVAEWLGVSKPTLYRMLSKPRVGFRFEHGRDYIQLGKFRRWIPNEHIGSPKFETLAQRATS